MIPPQPPELIPDRGRIVLADDHELIREGITAVIARAPEFTLCGTAGTEQATRETLARHRPNVLVIDLSISQRDEISFLLELLSAQPALRVLVLAAYAEERYADRVLHSGASGYFLKSESGAQLLQAIRTVASGKVYANPRLALLSSSLHRGHAIAVPSWTPAQ